MNKFKEARMRCGIAQKTVASKLNVSIQSVSNWENDSRSPSRENVIKMAEMYGVSIDYLLNKQAEDIQHAVDTQPVEIKKEPITQDEFSDLSEAERQLLKSFRRCSSVSRARVLAYAEGASDHL